jgi:predicted CXXCH cytochrome family protein
MAKWLLAALIVVPAGWASWTFVIAPQTGDADDQLVPPPVGPLTVPRVLVRGNNLTVWWGTPELAGPHGAQSSDRASNIHPSDYTGPATCRQCHPAQYQSWSGHAHRWMNAQAGEDTIRGDFSGASIKYRSGTAAFEKRDGGYWMRLERDGVRRVYKITQTIGSRNYQYYVGRLAVGPESATHHFYHKDHLLPFGYWLDRKEWVPVVHIGPERPDGERADPFQPPDGGVYYAEYAASCNYCHTTFPLGDLFARRPHQMGQHAPLKLHWAVDGYLKGTHPAEYEETARIMSGAANSRSVRNPMAAWEASEYAVTLGVSCEACHLGAKEHVRSGGAVKPRFFPSSPHLWVEASAPPNPGRTHDNVNWACGRCHTGSRPTFAAGMSTWNSVEYTDAMKGSCYSQLRCIDCHDPHTTIGPKWTAPPERGDAVCLKCHQKFQEPAPRAAHTHHEPGSAGDRCLNCHMPRINEGLSDVVRTHMIYSPTRADMLYANQPNACNLCHTDRPIDWTLTQLGGWYGKTYDGGKIAANYPHRSEPAAIGWLKSPNESVRLVAANALTRAKDTKALPLLLDALDDEYLLNRQFTGDGLERMLGVRLSDWGYHFYQMKDERQKPLTELRKKLLPPAAR